MRKKTAIYMLIAAILILIGSIYMLFFGKTGFLNAERRAESAVSSGEKENGSGEEKQETSDDTAQTSQREAAQENVQTAEGNESVRLTFSMGSDEYAEKILPQEVLDAVEAINRGESLAKATGMTELEGYFALTTTHMIIAKDEETGEEATGSGRLTIYVPNLLDGLTDVSALFYDCAGGQWRVIPAEAVDAANKRISVTLNGTGVMTTIYRLE